MHSIIIQSHRGAGTLSTDNTLEAFQLGWALGTVPECDVRTTSDGVIVAFHDEDLQRVIRNADSAMKKAVSELTWKELSVLDVGSWKDASFAHHRVPRLTDVFVEMKGRPERQLYMDIKSVDLPELARQVREARVGPQVIFASPDYPQIQRWVEMVPDGRTLLWMGTWGKDDEAILEAKFQELRSHNFAAVTQLQIHAWLRQPLESIRRVTVDPFYPSDAFFRKAASELSARNILFQSLPWGGGKKEAYWKLLDLGVRSFASDHPDVTLAALKNYQPPNSIS